MTRWTRLPVMTLLLAGAAAHGETDPIEACAAAHADDPPAHIECLAAALRAERARHQLPAPAANGTARVASGAAAPAATHATANEETGEAPDEVARTRQSEPASPAAPAPSGLGAEQVVKADPDPASREVTVQIVAATYDARGIGTFRTADGQTWRETMPSPVHRRLKKDTQYSARIERGTFGGYRMYVDGVRRMKTVERVE